MKTVFINPERCIGCKQCQIACAVEHSTSKNIYQAVSEPVISPPRILVARGMYLNTSLPNKCRHCDPAPCMTVCPTGAISRNADLGMVLVDGYKCITCAMCAMVCPFDVLTFYPLPAVELKKSVAVKCDQCIDRQRQGKTPACVEACKVYLKDGRITGFQLVGDIRAAGIYRTLMNKGTDVESLRDHLLEPGFGMGYIPDQSLLWNLHTVAMP